jgi:hypothetical protein
MANLTATPRTFKDAAAVLNGKDWAKIGYATELQTEITPKGRSIVAMLHGNKIVRYTPDGTYASWAGWATPTTADRIRQLTGVPAYVKGGEAYLDGEETLPREWVKLY